ncbi:hypothetical protein ACI8AF_21860 [Blastococcus sp. SYSU D00669]
MPSFRGLVALTAVVVLSACGGGGAGGRSGSPGAPAPAEDTRPWLDEVTATVPLDAAGAEAVGVVRTRERDAVVLLRSPDRAPALARVLADTTEPDVVELTALDPGAPVLLLNSVVGRVIAVGFSGGRLATNPVTADGQQATVPLAADLTPATVAGLLAAESTYGDTLHLVVTDPAGASRLVSASTYAGTVLAEVPLTLTTPGPVVPRFLTATEDGATITLVAEAGGVPVLARFDSELQPLGEVPLPGSSVLAAHPDDESGFPGQVHVAVADGTGVSVVRVGADETAAEVVASLPGAPSVRTLWVDGSDDHAYLGGASWEAVPLSDGEPATVELCADGEVTAVDAEYAVGRCAGVPTLWVLG